ncbi:MULTISPECIES: alanine/glycine:cation symporter family protein [Staphylococcus]|uniref:Alanine:cation symporter family protein n=4 Tax=Bacilli TaxID=91061 RepID=A0A4Q9WUF4_STAHO|nr:MULTISPECIES: alanine/glycine:cation symporter family protein [Staphylococcus]EUZ70306.1 AGCS family alanine or glycine:cation symporter [Staphylococcus sp. M0480]OFK82474.1 sodium:alanine symporter [Staphylococcus sp. HMSC057A02]OFM56778.1 sodium:alanine symporter [Staphylococcus sp. HMSC059G05]OFM63720.1 sodium:alanine symporter [Staphylococcus sp. HMSC062C01]OFM64105.1 sodium:alanine symporter [Staphylococcus sp. HMSC068D07]OFM80286.1 sodium:alanine symporter [Staphylococcus sp. HMSC074
MRDFDSLIPDWFKSVVQVGNDLIWSQYLIGLLLTVGIFFTISSKFVQLRMLPEMFRALVEKPETLKNGEKGISPFQAFAISAGSRVGTGNIAGVATAIVLGGPGAVFWMWIIAFIGAASAFIEATLAQVYKVHDKEGGFRGGPAYYITKGLNQKWLGITFAVLITVTFAFVFNTVQSNTIAESLRTQYHISPVITGIILAVITAIIIFGGVRSIATLSSLIVPIMAIVYVGIVLFILLMNFDQIIPMIGTIIKSAFGMEQVAGGAVGTAILQGIKRGLFSNEAGMGSAPNAAATAAVPHPVKQGLLQSLGVFFDTMLVCTATAIMILLYSGLKFGEKAPQGVEVTQSALNEHLGSPGGIFLTVAITLFAFSSVVGNYYYGQSNIEFLSKNKAILFIFRCLVVVLVFIGAVVKTETVWSTADLFMGLMAIVNLVSIIGLSNIAFAVMKDYIQQKRAGLKPVFKPENLEINLFGIESWGREDKISKKH